MASKIEDITVMGTVLYCDRCEKQGPCEVGEAHDLVAKMAEQDGWYVGCGDSSDPDLCPECRKRKKKA
jgi:hypothetical protein